jgi:2-oxoglutarate ferredoxin oxidoreductase subunit alpha
VVPGGYLLHDSASRLLPGEKRDDIHYLPVPLTELCIQNFSNAKMRPMLRNVVYVGALAALLGIDLEVIKGILTAQFSKKPKVLETNLAALRLGFDYSHQAFQCPLGIQVVKGNFVRDDILLDGNTAAALGAVYAGATVAAWYPITPSTSLVDAFGRFCEKYRVDAASGLKRFAIIQAEDELAAAGMVFGAGWNGARAFTATSGPGISLMNEFLGYGYYGEIPGVFFNVQRVGPSTGMPTRTQQADLLLCAYASHGDTKHVLIFPGTVKECFELSIKAFDLAELLQTPVIVLSDLELGMNEFMSSPLTWDESYQPNRGKVLRAQQLDELKKPYFRYTDVDGDGIPYRTLPGDHPTKGASLMRGSGHDRMGRYTEDPELYAENMERIAAKIQRAANLVPEPVITIRDTKAKVGVIHLGATVEPLHEALDMLCESHELLNDMRVRGFPFGDNVRAFAESHEKVIVIDQNRDAQLRHLLIAELDLNPARMKSVRSFDGQPLTARNLAAKIREAL